MTRSELKDKYQRQGLNKWFLAGCRGSLQWATGVGKTRAAVLASAHFAKIHGYDYRILIITPTETIRDKVWLEEFKKWKEITTFNLCVKMVCIQTAYKWIGQEFDLVILDEAHNYIPSFEDYNNKNYEYFKFFENNTMHKVLGLSASIEGSKLPVLNKIAKIVDTITTNEARKLGLVSDFEIFNLPIELTEEERNAYDKIDKQFNEVFGLFTDSSGFRNLSLMYKCLQSKQFFRSWLDSRSLSYDKYSSYPFMANSLMSKRKEIIYNAANKINTAVELLKQFPDRLAIIFSLTTPTSDKITELIGDSCVSFHSKLSKKQRTENFKRLNDGRTKIKRISAVKALNEGANIPKCSLIVIVSGTSKQKDFIQTIGRGIRFEEGKTAIIVRLYAKGTQEEQWVKSSQIGYITNTINSIEDARLN